MGDFGDARVTTRVGILFAVCAALLVPWIVVVAITLPSQRQSVHYDLAWAGFDTMLLVALAATAVSALRRSAHLALASSWCAALLVADAWFDVVTAPTTDERMVAVAMAALVELPLAVACVWLSRHAQEIAAGHRTQLAGQPPGR